MAGRSSKERERTRDRDRGRDRHGKEHHRRSPHYYRDNSDEDDYHHHEPQQHRRYRYDEDFEGYERVRRGRDRSRSPRRDRDKSRDGDYYDRDYPDDVQYDDEYGGEEYGHDRDERRDRGYRNRDGYRDSYRDRRDDRDEREEIPNNTLMVRGLALHISENDIMSKLTEAGLQAKDIRLMRKKDSGDSRGFAFVEFFDLPEAVQWKEFTQGVLDFDDECQATIHYSIPKDRDSSDKNVMKNDWCCYKCGVNNFKRREQCFKCGTDKEESLANNPSGDEISGSPTNCLLLRNLSLETTEERILTILGTITDLPIKSIRILKDVTNNVSRGVCLLELHTTLEASQIYTMISAFTPSFIIDDCEVSVNYGKRNVQNTQMSMNVANIASSALAAAQWTNQREDTTSTSQQVNAMNLGTVSVNGVDHAKYPIPDTSTYQYDESSGYYYDELTGFYYDANTHYYYNSHTQKYMYWDSNYETYLSVESQSNTSNGISSTATNKSANNSSKAKSSQVETKKEKEKSKDMNKSSDKVKIAKKLAKDMEKWAKSQNQKKETGKVNVPAMQVHMMVPLETQMSESKLSYSSGGVKYSCDTGFSILSDNKSFESGKKESQSSSSYSSIEPVLHQQTHSNLDKKKNARTENESKETGSSMSIQEDPIEIIRAEEERLTDRSKLACLLCKRQFGSEEQLSKHQQLSELHKTNLDALKRSKLSEEQLEQLEREESEAAYRDRARERRAKKSYTSSRPTNVKLEENSSDKSEYKYNSELESSKQALYSSNDCASSSSSSPSFITNYAIPNAKHKPIPEDNIGNKMLKAMGWSEGKGLGRHLQGSSNIVEVEARHGSEGLGMRTGSVISAGETYKDAVRRAMQERFKQLNEK